jgi:hypothetical protein
MKTIVIPALLLCAGATAACSEDEPGADAEACEHIKEGPYTSVTATTARDGTTPAVRADHMAYTITLPAGAVGHVSFAAAEVIDYIVFLDKPVPLQVLDGSGATVAIEASETSSPECAEVRGRHTIPLPVGTAYLALGPSMGMPFNLVVEEAAAHDER